MGFHTEGYQTEIKNKMLCKFKNGLDSTVDSIRYIVKCKNFTQESTSSLLRLLLKAFLYK